MGKRKRAKLRLKYEQRLEARRREAEHALQRDIATQQFTMEIVRSLLTVIAKQHGVMP